MYTSLLEGHAQGTPNLLTHAFTREQRRKHTRADESTIIQTVFKRAQHIAIQRAHELTHHEVWNGTMKGHIVIVAAFTQENETVACFGRQVAVQLQRNDSITTQFTNTV